MKEDKAREGVSKSTVDPQKWVPIEHCGVVTRECSGQDPNYNFPHGVILNMRQNYGWDESWRVWLDDGDQYDSEDSKYKEAIEGRHKEYFHEFW